MKRQNLNGRNSDVGSLLKSFVLFLPMLKNIYTHIKVEAAKRDINASDIVSEVVVEWIESREDIELVPLIKESQKEVKKVVLNPGIN